MKKALRLVAAVGGPGGVAERMGCNTRTAVRRLKKYNKQKKVEVVFQFALGGPWYADSVMLRRYLPGLVVDEDEPQPAKEATLIEFGGDLAEVRKIAETILDRIDVLASAQMATPARGGA